MASLATNEEQQEFKTLDQFNELNATKSRAELTKISLALGGSTADGRVQTIFLGEEEYSVKNAVDRSATYAILLGMMEGPHSPNYSPNVPPANVDDSFELGGTKDDIGNMQAPLGPNENININTTPPISTTAITANVQLPQNQRSALQSQLLQTMNIAIAEKAELNRRLKAEFDEMCNQQVPTLAEAADAHVRGRVRQLLIPLFLGLNINVQAQQGGPPVALSQTLGMPSDRDSPFRVRPGMVRLWSPGATRLLRSSGRINSEIEVNEMTDNGQWQQNENENDTNWKTFIAPLSKYELELYFHSYDLKIEGQGRATIYYAVVPQGNALFNATEEQIGRWINNFVDTQCRWVVQRNYENLTLSQRYETLVAAYLATNQITRDILEQLSNTGVRIRLRAQAVSDSLFTQSHQEAATRLSDRVPIEQIAIDLVGHIRNIQNAYMTLRNLQLNVGGWMTNQDDRSWWQRLKGTLTPLQLITAAREALWTSLARYHAWYAGTVAVRNGVEETAVALQNMTFGGRYRGDQLEGEHLIADPINIAITEWPQWARRYVLEYFLSESTGIQGQQVVATQRAQNRAQQTFRGDIATTSAVSHTQNVYAWINSEAGSQWLAENADLQPSERARQLANMLRETIDLNTGRTLRESYQQTDKQQQEVEEIGRRAIEEGKTQCEAVSSGSTTTVCETLTEPLYSAGDYVWVYPPERQQALEQSRMMATSSPRNVQRTDRLQPVRARIIAAPGMDMPPNVRGINYQKETIPLLANQYVLSISRGSAQNAVLFIQNTAELNLVAVRKQDSKASGAGGRQATYVSPDNDQAYGEILFPNYENAMHARQNAVGHAAVAIRDILEKEKKTMGKMTLKQMNAKREEVANAIFENYISSAGGQEDRTEYEAGVQEIFAQNGEAMVAQGVETRGQIQPPTSEQLETHAAALMAHHPRNDPDIGLQNILFNAYRIYVGQFLLLQKLWRMMHSLDSERYQNNNGQRTVPEEWYVANSPINENAVGWSRLNASNPRERRAALPATFAYVFNNLVRPWNNYTGLTINTADETRAVTAGGIWNNGQMREFAEFLGDFVPVMLNNTIQSTQALIDRAYGGIGANRLMLNNLINIQQINDSYRTWLQEISIQQRQRREQEEQQNLAAEEEAARREQQDDMEDNDDDDDDNPQPIKRSRKAKKGGRRKKKTRRKKMRGRKKKTRKTRNKRGGETPTEIKTATEETQPASTEENPTKYELPPIDIREKIIEAIKANDEKYKKEAEELGESLAMAKLKYIEDMMKKGNTGEPATETGDDPIEEQPVVGETSTTTTGTETEEKGEADDQPVEEEAFPETSPMDVNVVEEEEQYAGSNCAKEIAFLESDKSKKLPKAVLIKKQEEFKKDDNKCANFPDKIPEIEGLLAKRLEEIKQSVETETPRTGDDQPVEKQEEEQPIATETATEQQEETSPLETQVSQEEVKKTPEEQAAEEALEAKGICDDAMKNTPWEKLSTEGAVNKKGKELKGKCPEDMAGQIDDLIAKRLGQINKAAKEAAALEQKKQEEAKKAEEAAALGQKCKADQEAYAQKISDLTESPPETFPTKLEEEGKAITERCQTVEGLSKKIEEQSNILRQAIQKALTKKAADEAAALAAQKKKEDEEAALVAEQKKKEDEAAALAAQKKKEDEEAAAALALAEQKKKDDEAAAQPQYHDQKRINVTAVPNKKACDEVKIAPDTLYYTCNDGIYTDPTKSKKDESCKVQPPRSAGKDGKDYFWNKETGKVGYDMEKTCSSDKKGMKITEVKTGKKCNKVGQNVYNIECKTKEQKELEKCKKSPCHKPDTNKPKPCNDFKARECEKDSAGRCELEKKKDAQKRTGKTPKKLKMSDRKCQKKSPTSGGYKNKSLKKKKRRKRKNKYKSLKKRR